VYRRYNSPYNFIIEDANGDIHLHQDHTVRTSLQSILCLSELDSQRLYTLNATSFKHNGPVETMPKDIADMRWSQIQAEYHAVNVNFGGIFEEYHRMDYPQENTTPVKQERQEQEQEQEQDQEAANILLTISIPRINEEQLLRENDSAENQSYNCDTVYRRGREPECYCFMTEEDEQDSYSDVDKRNYTVLRSGTMIPKPTQ
jgi:hypothetical protein